MLLRQNPEKNRDKNMDKTREYLLLNKVYDFNRNKKRRSIFPLSRCTRVYRVTMKVVGWIYGGTTGV